MGFEKWGYHFDGAYPSPESLDSRAGVYVIWCKDGERWTVLDIGEAADVKERVTKHDRTDCWTRHCSGEIYYSATYTPNLQQSSRMTIEQSLRDIANPPCGRR